ncbi:hypothetical protein ATL41_0056 [Flavimobilis soli]|uniref:Uncharacterized protein n=1 Tax=Flavimobilis soli TaxID=442709 RepID=A0A2A9E9Y1_9MICO|nr:hypothetical protein [Flavimobilis soli]PFG35381.1 hypothetical protein ATL41_0056 [Flavimobilis soli]
MSRAQGHDDVTQVPGVHVPVLGAPTGPPPGPRPLRWRLPLVLVAPASFLATYAALFLTVLGWAAVQHVFEGPPAVTVTGPADGEGSVVDLLGPLFSTPALLMVGGAAAIMRAGAVWCARRPAPARTGAVVGAAISVPLVVAAVVVPLLSGEGYSAVEMGVVVIMLVLLMLGLPVAVALVLVLRQAGVTVRGGGAYPVAAAA